MNTQPYALKVAELLDDELRHNIKLTTLYAHTADELRQLHEVNTGLVEALKVLSALVWNGESFDQVTEAALALAAEAINKAEGK